MQLIGIVHIVPKAILKRLGAPSCVINHTSNLQPLPMEDNREKWANILYGEWWINPHYAKENVARKWIIDNYGSEMWYGLCRYGIRYLWEGNNATD